MKNDPTLETARLRLRPYTKADIPALLPLIGAREIAAMTVRIPHPYTENDANEFMAKTQTDGEVRLGIRLRGDESLIGGVGLRLDPQHQHAELGYWLGVPYWGHGYATEASREMMRYGFEELKLHRIYASHFGHNPVSGRVLRKLGMRYEGCQRGHLRKWDEFIDLELYGLLREDWQKSQGADE
jgi:[ribosomal protein S5]-alanine N-acetyltransferase